jgi:transcriptional regulator with XRE-family HTH domain
MIRGDCLAHARTTRGLSQRKLAHLVGLNYQVIRRIEAGGTAGNLTLGDLGRICRVLEITPSSLLDDPASGVRSTTTVHDGIAELDLAQARLLRRIQRREDVRRSLGRDERELVLPHLVRIGLVSVSRGGPHSISATARQDLVDPT